MALFSLHHSRRAAFLAWSYKEYPSFFLAFSVNVGAFTNTLQQLRAEQELQDEMRYDGVRLLKEIALFEGSVVSMPSNRPCRAFPIGA